MEKSRKAFQKSLNINEYQANCWFKLGFVFMRLDDFDQAINSFGRCVQIDESSSLAWANLSGLFMKQNKMSEAFVTISQATQRRERDPKIWYNHMMISFQAQKFPAFIKSVETLLDLHQKTCLEGVIIKRLNAVGEIYLDKVEEDWNQVRGTELIYDKIEKLYKRMGIEMAENQNVWKYYSNFHDFTADLYNIKLKMRATDLEKKKYFFYHEPEESSETFLKNMHIKKYETIQKWCKSIMVVGWENIIENNLDLIESTHEL